MSRLEVDNKALLKSKKEVACLTDKQHNQQEQSDTQLVQKGQFLI